MKSILLLALIVVALSLNSTYVGAKGGSTIEDLGRGVGIRSDGEVMFKSDAGHWYCYDCS